MRVESRNLVDLGERKLHLLCERSKMSSGEMTVTILNKVQMFDQKIALAGTLTEQFLHLCQWARIDLPAFRGLRRSASPARGLVIHGDRASLRTVLRSFLRN